MAKNSNAQDVEDIFDFLRKGSYNHYWAFDRALKNKGVAEGCCTLGTEYCHPEYPKNGNRNRNRNGHGHGHGHGNWHGNGNGHGNGNWHGNGNGHRNGNFGHGGHDREYGHRGHRGNRWFSRWYR
ncbi:MAG: hypothetical protein DSZ09_03250 [Sulfurovum sp.]|nr:MAG: hypothetical protein DSZ09_03250 [Sulfurovum sp.]